MVLPDEFWYYQMNFSITKEFLDDNVEITKRNPHLIARVACYIVRAEIETKSFNRGDYI